MSEAYWAGANGAPICILHRLCLAGRRRNTARGARVIRHEGNAVREFYAALEGPVVVGLEATVNSPVWLSNIAMLCCFACRSTPTIFISASFARAFFGWYRKVYSGVARPTYLCHQPRCYHSATVLSLYSEQRGCIVAYLGTHQHLAVDIHASVDTRGGMCIRSGEQRFYEGLVGFRFPMAFSGIADVCEWFDDGDQKFHIDVNVHNDVWGPLFGYTGSFTAEWVPITDGAVLAELVPVRYERRE